MQRTTNGKVATKRTVRPLYYATQATYKAGELDPDSVDKTIWPGMAMMKTEGDNYALLDGVGTPVGLSALFINVEGRNEATENGTNKMSVIVMGPDAEFEVDAPAFDASATWTESTDGTEVLVHALTTGPNQGQLVPAGTTNASAAPVARLLKVESEKTIRIGGLTA